MLPLQQGFWCEDNPSNCTLPTQSSPVTNQGSHTDMKELNSPLCRSSFNMEAFKKLSAAGEVKILVGSPVLMSTTNGEQACFN